MARGRALALTMLVVSVTGCSEGDDSTSATTTTVDLGPDTGDGTLAIATADLPASGQAAVELARRDINAGGGVLGEPVVLVQADGEADAVIGPEPHDGAVSFVTEPGTVPPTPDLAFSTVPSAALRAQAVADVVAGDRMASVAVLAPDPGLATALSGGGVSVVDATHLDEVVDQSPEAVVLPAGREAAEDIAALIDAGYTTGDHRFYLVGDRVDPALGFDIGDRPGVLEGIRVIQPGAEVDEDLRTRLLDVDERLEDLSGAPEAYDATIIIALAAEAAGTDDPDHVAAEVPDVTRGGDTCTSYEECRTYLADGSDIAYVGLGGAYELDEDGEPTRSVFTVYEYGGDNLIDPNRSEFLVAVLVDG